MVADRKNKRKIAKILVSIAITIGLLASLFIFFDKKIGMFLYEADYKMNNDTKSLVKLCFMLHDTYKFNKKIEYFPKILNYDEYSRYNKEFEISQDTEKIDKTYNMFINEYLFSFLTTGDYKGFEKNYLLYYNKYREVGIKNEFIIEIGTSDNTTKEQKLAIIETLEKLNSSTELRPIDKIGNLNILSLIYESIGNLDQAKKIDLQVDSIFKEEIEKKKNTN